MPSGVTHEIVAVSMQFNGSIVVEAILFLLASLDGVPQDRLKPTWPSAIAPILWLSPDEFLYPVLPHAFAFDGIDNDGDGLFDFEDVDELSFESRSSDQGTQLKWLDSVYRPEPGSLKLQGFGACGFDRKIQWRCQEPRVLFSETRPFSGAICEVEASDRALADLARPQLPASIRNACPELFEPAPGDPTAAQDFVVKPEDQERSWRVMKPKAPDTLLWPETRVILEGTKLVVRIGHRSLQYRPATNVTQFWYYFPFDVGHVDDAEHVSIFTDRETGRVRGVVAAGHGDESMNAMLIAQTRFEEATLGPATLPNHPVILIELGKHASAPDRICDGQFQVGQDANVFPEGVWGIRDSNVANRMTANVKKFENWMSFPRVGGPNLLVPSGVSADETFAASCPPESPVTAAVRSPHRTDLSRPYRLVRLELLRELHSKIKEGKTAFQEFLQQHRAELWPADLQNLAVPADLSDEAFEAIKRWKPSVKTAPRWFKKDRRYPWLHSNLLDPERDFKRDLVKRVRLGVEAVREDGNSAWGAVARFRGFSLLRHGSLDAAVTLDQSVSGKLGLSRLNVEYNAFTTSFTGFYAGFGWAFRSETPTAVTIVTETPGGSVASRAVIIEERPPTPEFRAGFSLQYQWKRPFKLITLRFGIAAPLNRFTDRNTAFYEKAKISSAIRFVVALRIFPFALWNGRHPLAR